MENKTLSENEYRELNNYLNEVMVYLNESFPEIPTYLKQINEIAHRTYTFLRQYNFETENKKSNLPLQEILELTEKILKTIDSKYVEQFKTAIANGSIEFIENDPTVFNYYKYPNNRSYIHYDHPSRNKLIYIDREYNYVDVQSIIHEFIHYIIINLDNKYQRNVELLTEFLAIYFETYAVEYLVASGVDKYELEYSERLENTKDVANELISSSLLLLVYDKLGNINSNTINDIDLLNLSISVPKEKFDKLCINAYETFKHSDNSPKNIPNYKDGTLTYINDIMKQCKYTIGTLLAFYARKYNDMNDILWLNNNIETYDTDVVSLLQKANIKIFNNDFLNNTFIAIDEYITKFDIKVKK